MSNELQVRLSADITALVSALTKAKNTIKSFESETAKESEKGNVGFKRKIGLIEELTAKSRLLKTALAQATNEAQVKSYNKELEKTTKEIARLTSLGKMAAPVAIQKTLGIIGQLEKKAKDLRISLANATDENDISRYNQALEETSKELTRLNALGRSVSANLGSVGGGFGQVAKQTSNASGVAIEFNRVIQDAPFGLIGIGNNLQQLAGNFANLSKTAGGTGKALAATFTSLISPVNLGLLAISALTAGFTAYQMGAFDGIFATEDFSAELDKFRESLSEDDSARLESIKTSDQEIIKLNSLRAIIEDETVSRDKRLLAVKELRDQFPTISKNLSDEAFLAGQVGKAYEEVTKQLIAKAEVESSVKRIVDLNDQERLILEQSKDKLDEINEVRARIASFQETANKAEIDLINAKDVSEKDLALRRKLNAENQIRFLRSENEEVNQLLKIGEDRVKLTEIANNALKETLVNTDEVVKATETSIETFEKQAEKLGLISSKTAEISRLNEQKDLAKDQEEINLLTGKINLLKEELNLINAIAKRANTPIDLGITANLPERDGNVGVTNPEGTGNLVIPEDVQTSVTDNLKEQKSLVDELSGAYAGLGSLIGKAFDNAPFGQFLGTFIAFAAKMVAANFKIAASNAISGASNAALATGPAAPISLPAFIAGSLGVVAAAFAAIGGGGKSASVGGGGGGSMGSGRSPQLFTNAFAPSIPASSSPTPSGSIDFDRAQGRLTTTVTGEDISFVYDRYQERKKGGG